MAQRHTADTTHRVAKLHQSERKLRHYEGPCHGVRDDPRQRQESFLRCSGSSDETRPCSSARFVLASIRALILGAPPERSARCRRPRSHVTGQGKKALSRLGLLSPRIAVDA